MSIKDLKNNPSYSLLLVLPHDEMAPFISEQFSGKTMAVRGYLALNFLLVAIILLIATFDIRNEAIDIWSVMKYFGAGSILFFIVLVIIHEGLHGLAYKLVGAPKISFGANWRMFYFYAVADRFVIRRKSFIFIALIPFVVISVLVLAAMFVAPIHWKWLLFGILFIHTTACAGDFAMLGFYERYRNAREMLTYDDVSEKRSYFYLKE